jgi:hypothetical protein
MAWDTKIAGAVSNNPLEVDTDNQALVTTNADPTKAGASRLFSECDPGTVTAPLLLSPETSEDYRLRVGVDALLAQESFCNTVQDTGKSRCTTSTMALANTGSALTTNSGSITTNSSGVLFQTGRFFPVGGQQTPTYVEMNFAMTANVMATNSTLDIGLFIPNAANPFAPTDGVYLRFNSTGVFLVTFNSTGGELQTQLTSFVPVANQVYQIILAITNRAVQVWIDDVLHEKRAVAAGLGQPFNSGSLPFALRHAIAGGAAGSVVQGKLYSYSVYGGDLDRVKDWGSTCAVAGGSLQVQQGATTGGQLTAVPVGGTAPTVIALTANTAPATNNPGGYFTLPTSISIGEADYPIYAWQNPAGTTAIPGKTFHCTGCVIGDLGVSTVLTGGPLLMSWAVAYGALAATGTLATTESGSYVSPTTKSPRRIPTGIMQALAAAAPVTTISKGGTIMFDPPLPVLQGEWLHAILRVFGGTATSAGAIRGSVTFLGYFD